MIGTTDLHRVDGSHGDHELRFINTSDMVSGTHFLSVGCDKCGSHVRSKHPDVADYNNVQLTFQTMLLQFKREISPDCETALHLNEVKAVHEL